MGTLYVVATPIGNLEDVTLRALRVLGEAELVLAEDTRRTRTLLTHHGVGTRPRSLHAHNEARRSREVLEALASGRSVALVSDAGTPLVSDPGERLVAAVIEAGHPVVPVPGPSAVLSALVASGLPAAPFLFLGFLPRRRGEQEALLARIRDRAETIVLFESPRRLAATLRRLLDALGDRPACVARELTKLHEEIARGSLGELADRFGEGTRGEVTLVVAGAPGDEVTDRDEEALDAEIRRLVAAGKPAREIAAELAPRSKMPKREIYARVVAVREGR
jgi:16S rRNA (cytidine1402-2'-O)-methyltransferase